MSVTAPRSLHSSPILRLHGAAGLLGFLTILTFWTSTVASELFGSPATVAAVKQAIAWALLLLVPALAIAGLSGFRMAGAATAPRLAAKRRRMPLIALNGVLVLVPCAVTLAVLAGRGDFGATFQAVQALELMAGLVNLVLIGLNIRDGRALTARRASAIGGIR
ncbi:hypothetical protein RHODGE_RHODGE_04858 [Rhodoplanes serenus]|uniref:Transmembrane protein n=1 Tax=Rhodoplanes serenus TaxID=200615 RepID=A0A447D2A5_9BRAD|nr:hypothetical protein [Rhodoplanes serenus]VCU11644.1 hypothetical protein RHODGE_RHODGE_04858 [Rhodoplanes serenus]